MRKVSEKNSDIIKSSVTDLSCSTRNAYEEIINIYKEIWQNWKSIGSKQEADKQVEIPDEGCMKVWYDFMLSTTFWRILYDSYKIFYA